MNTTTDSNGRSETLPEGPQGTIPERKPIHTILCAEFCAYDVPSSELISSSLISAEVCPKIFEDPFDSGGIPSHFADQHRPLRGCDVKVGKLFFIDCRDEPCL